MPPSADEALWVLRAQSGDREALESLLAANREMVGRYIASIVGRPDADDVTQEVLFLVYRKLGWLESPELFRPWLFRLASRAAFRHLKKTRRWRESQVEDDIVEELPAVETPPTGLVDELSTIDGLSPASRAVLVLHFQQGLPLPEVAAVLGIPVGTAKSRLAYGLTTLRNHLRNSQERK